MARPGRTIRSETITSEVSANMVIINLHESGGNVVYRFQEIMRRDNGDEVNRTPYAELRVNLDEVLGKTFGLSDGSVVTGAQVFEAFELQGDELIADHEDDLGNPEPTNSETEGMSKGKSK